MLQTFKRLSCVAAVMLMTGLLQAHPAGGIVADARGRVFFTFVNPLHSGGHKACIWRLGEDRKLVEVYTSAHDPSDLILTLGLDGHVYAAERRYLGERQGKDVFESRLLRLREGGVDTVIPATTDRTLFNAEVIAVDRKARVFFTDRKTLRRRDHKGAVTVVKLRPTKTTAKKKGTRPIQRITALRCLQDGSLILLDLQGVHRVTEDGQFETVADGLKEVKPRELPWSGANILFDVAVDAGGRPCVAYFGGRRVLRIEKDRSVTTLLQVKRPWSTHAIAVHGKRMYILASSVNDRKIRPRIYLLGEGEPRVVFEGS